MNLTKRVDRLFMLAKLKAGLYVCMYVPEAPLDSNGRPNRAKLASGHELLVIRLLASTIIEVLCKKSQLHMGRVAGYANPGGIYVRPHVWRRQAISRLVKLQTIITKVLSVGLSAVGLGVAAAWRSVEYPNIKSVTYSALHLPYRWLNIGTHHARREVGVVGYHCELIQTKNSDFDAARNSNCNFFF